MFDHDVRYIREDLVMVGWKCQNPDCGEVLFGPSKPDTCHCGGDLVLASGGEGDRVTCSLALGE